MWAARRQIIEVSIREDFPDEKLHPTRLALRVKKEIERIDETPTPFPAVLKGGARTTVAGESDWGHDEWKGDHKVVTENGEVIFELTANQKFSKTVMYMYTVCNVIMAE